MDKEKWKLEEEEKITKIYTTKFILTPFAERFEGSLFKARRLKQWCIIGAYSRNGKSWCLRDISFNSGALKAYNGETHIPVIAVRSPIRKGGNNDLLFAISSAIGQFPKMNSVILERWMIENIPKMGVEQIIIDDAHELNQNHYKFIKWLTDSLELEMGYKLSIALVSIIDGNRISAHSKIKQYCGEGWMQQLYERFHYFDVIPGLNPEEVLQVLYALEDIYRVFLPKIDIAKYANNIYAWLTSSNFDVHYSNRVAMHHLSKLVYESVRTAYLDNSLDDIPGDLLKHVYKYKLLEADKVYDLSEDKEYKPSSKKDKTVSNL